MFRLWIERRFSRPVTAAGTVRIGRSAALCGAASTIYVRKKGPLMKHSPCPAGFFWCWLGPWPCRHWRWGSISMIIATPIEAPDQSESRFFSHYNPKTVEWFMSIL